MRLLPILLLSTVAAPAATQTIALSPSLGTQLRYEQYVPDRLLAADDAILVRARPGVALSMGPWSIGAVSDAAIQLRRSESGTTAGRTPIRPDALQLGELKLEYRGLPRAAFSVGRQHLDIADAAITGDRDGEQTFDAARLRWNGLPGITADLAYAWSSSSQWAAMEGPLPATIAGDNIFARLDWAGPLGTLSGYAYQIDQRRSANSEFRLINQVYGARFSGSRRVGEDLRLGYSLGFVRQTGSLANAPAGAPTYWQMGNSFDLTDLSATRTSYRRFAANGINATNGDMLSLATNASRGRLTVGATYNDFRPVADTRAIAARDLRLSLGLIF